MLMNNKFKAQILTWNPTWNLRGHVLASHALNMSCNFGMLDREQVGGHGIHTIFTSGGRVVLIWSHNIVSSSSFIHRRYDDSVTATVVWMISHHKIMILTEVSGGLSLDVWSLPAVMSLFMNYQLIDAGPCGCDVAPYWTRVNMSFSTDIVPTKYLVLNSLKLWQNGRHFQMQFSPSF